MAPVRAVQLFAAPAIPQPKRAHCRKCLIRMSDDNLPAKPGRAPQYSQRARLREETEAPFRKVRMFVYAGSAASAGVGAFIASLRVVAALVGVSGVQPLTETVPNVAIDLAVIGVCAFLLRRENMAGERRLERMSRGARLAKLRVTDPVTGAVAALSGFRGKSRVVIVAGTAAKVLEALKGAEGVREELAELDILVAPLVTDEKWNERPTEFPREPWVLNTFANEEWMKWYEIERDAARFRLGESVDDILVVVVRLDGKVGARSTGMPVFERLVGEVKMLPTRDQYGRP